MNMTIAVAEDGMTRMRDALRNGVMEQELWAYMWSALIEGGRGQAGRPGAGDGQRANHSVMLSLRRRFAEQRTLIQEPIR
jgi:hypothetical protein